MIYVMQTSLRYQFLLLFVPFGYQSLSPQTWGNVQSSIRYCSFSPSVSFFFYLGDFVRISRKTCREVELKYVVWVRGAYSSFGPKWWCANGSTLAPRTPTSALTSTITIPVPIPRMKVRKVAFVSSFHSILGFFLALLDFGWFANSARQSGFETPPHQEFG